MGHHNLYYQPFNSLMLLDMFKFKCWKGSCPITVKNTGALHEREFQMDGSENDDALLPNFERRLGTNLSAKWLVHNLDWILCTYCVMVAVLVAPAAVFDKVSGDGKLEDCNVVSDTEMLVSTWYRVQNIWDVSATPRHFMNPLIGFIFIFQF